MTGRTDSVCKLYKLYVHTVIQKRFSREVIPIARVIERWNLIVQVYGSMEPMTEVDVVVVI